VASDDFERQALQHLDALYNFAIYLTRNPPEADDLVQETYLRAFRFSHRFQAGTHLRAWLFQILRNTFLTFYRLRERETAIADDGVPDWDVPMFQDAPEYTASAMEAHTDLERAMSRLPEEFRTVLLLAEVEGMPLEEVARVMGCPVGTVKSRIFRAKERLRTLLSDYVLFQLPPDEDWFALRDVNEVDGVPIGDRAARLKALFDGPREQVSERAMEIAKESARFILCTGYDFMPGTYIPYTVNLPLNRAVDDDVLLVHTWEGKPLPREHGGPVRMITPKLYAWKGAKWIRKIEFLAEDQKGFWEVRGYSNSAEPWFNDRYATE